MRYPVGGRHPSAKAVQLRLGMFLAVGTLALIVWSFSTLSVQAAQLAPTATPTPDCPSGEFWDPFMMRCVLIKRECPAGRIDVNGDGTVCEAVDPVASPSFCLAWPAGPALPTVGAVECALPLQAGGVPLRLSGSVGCLNVTRRPFPRAMVNIPVEYRVTAIIPPALLSGIAFGDPGSYRLSATDPWATEGLYLHERYGAVTTDSYGQPAFDTRALLAGDVHPYPSVNNVRARLEFKLATAADELNWSTAGFPQSFQGGLRDWAKTVYARSSFPLPGSTDYISHLGPALNGTNSLPAFKVTVQSQWDLYLYAEWDEFAVNDAHAYVLTGHRQTEVRVGHTYTSFRTWDIRQNLTGAAGIYCNAAQGYLPVPVIEGQTVLR